MNLSLRKCLGLAALLALSLAAGPARAAEKPIKIGICTSIDKAADMKAMGFDYVELGLSTVAKMSDDKFAKLKKDVEAAPLKPESMNGFMSAPLVVVGEKVDLKPVEAYMKKAFQRANELGTKILVYGSAGTRKIPDGFPKEKAVQQMVDFLRLAAEVAKPYPNLTIVIEPLRPQESNFINTAKEGLDLVKKVDRPNVRAFGDLYHMGVQKESMAALLEGGSEWIKHIHIARTEGRKYPKTGDSSFAYYKELFDALHKINYVGRVSIEASPDKDFATDAPEALKCLRTLADAK